MALPIVMHVRVRINGLHLHLEQHTRDLVGTLRVDDGDQSEQHHPLCPLTGFAQEQADVLA